jgi:small subunit ribosomal protein S20
VANSKSALKRIAINERNRMRNKAYKSTVKTFMKKYFQAVEDYTSSPSEEQLKTVQTSMSVAYSKIDKAVKTGVYHKNNAARKKARLARALKKAVPQAS